MPFKIKIHGTPVSASKLQPGEVATSAEMHINDFSEQLVIPTNYWSLAEYEKQWINALETVIKGSEGSKSALITEMYDTSASHYALMWWPMYKSGGHIYIYSGYISLREEGLELPLSLPALYGKIPEREPEASVWTTSVEDAAEWLSKLKLKG